MPDTEVITLILPFLHVFQCKMDGNYIEKVLIPHIKSKRFQGTTEKLNLYLPGFSLLLVPQNGARSDSGRLFL